MGATPTPRPYWTPDAPVVRLSEPERTSIAEQIRTLVEGFSLTYTWLIRQLSDEGLMTDKFEMSATLAGVRTGSKADEILRRSLSILREYQERMGPCKEPRACLYQRCKLRPEPQACCWFRESGSISPMKNTGKHLRVGMNKNMARSINGNL